MFGSRFNSAKCETTCRLCIGRIKLIRNKKTVQLKQSQKDVAELLRSGKQEYARIRVEGVIREKLLMQAFEILELYLELMTVRAQLISKTKELPRDMMEAVSSIIYAAQRIADLPELSTLRQLFAAKYGKEYAMEAAADATTAKWAVNANLIRCLLVEAPQPEDKLAALSEIAQDHGVEWDLSAAARDMGVGASSDVGLGGGAPGAGGFPPGPPPSYGSGGSGHGHGGGGGGGGGSVPVPAAMPAMPPPAAPGQYTNAQQAAAAAAQAAAQARAAADYAAQVAAEMGAPVPTHAPVPGGPPPPTGWLVQPPAGGPPSHAGPPPPAHGADFLPTPPSGPVGALRTGQPGLSSEGSGPGSGGLPTPPHPHSSEPSAGSGGGAVGGYVVRSNEEIQRAYDAALGPPTKGQSAAPTAPPAAPPAPAPPPAPPAALAAPTPPPAVEDEYELLTKRLEALKRS